MQHPCTGLATLVHLQAKYADFLKRSIYFLKPNARIHRRLLYYYCIRKNV